MRTGKQYLESLDDGRTVFLGGREIKSVTKDAAFRNSANAVAKLYDVSADGFGGKVELPTDENGVKFNPAWVRPTSSADLELRRSAHLNWANQTFGLFGRSPDHVSAFIVGMACVPDAAGSEVFADNIVNYWKHARDNDLFLSYAIIPPGGEKGREAVVSSGQKGSAQETAALRLVRETDSGIVVRGTKTLATAAPIADELLIGNILPLNPGEEDFALTFAVPIGVPGLKVISRKSYAEHAVSAIDDPLSSRYDELDAVVYFDDVHVPWERVFSYRDLEAGRALFYDTPAHCLGNAQAHIRLLSKMRLMIGLLHALTEEIGTADIPPVKDLVASLVTRVAMLEAMIDAEHVKPHSWPNDFLSQDLQSLYATMVWSAEYYTRHFVPEIRELMGSHIFQQPADISAFENETTQSLLMKALHVNRTLDDARYRYKILKILWDLVGSEFACRHIQYESLYAGPKPVTRGRAYHYFRWDDINALTRLCLETVEH